MPFFTMQTPRQIHDWCQEQTFERLQGLNHRYGNFIEKISTKEDQNNVGISAINQQIAELNTQIAKNKVEIDNAKKSNQNIYDALPTDGAERHLMLQAVYFIEDIESDLTKQIVELEKQKKALEASTARIRNEIQGCIAELKILSPIMEAKRMAATPQPEMTPSH